MILEYLKKINSLTLATLKLVVGFTIIFSLSCKSKDDFNFFDEGGNSGEPEVEEIEITGFTPTQNPVILSANTLSNTTFAVSVNSGAGTDITYDFKLNGTSQQSGADPFYSLSSAFTVPGLNSLEVKATNSISSASKIFNIRKNNPPVITNSNPSATGNNVACNGSNITFDVTASDNENDSLTFDWKLNGVTGSSYMSDSSTATTSSATFTPDCSAQSSSSVTIEINDGYDITSYTWAVVVSNPLIATVDAFSPTSDPVVIPSTGSQTFSVSTSGKSPLSHVWKLNGTDIPGETTTLVTLTAGSLSVGNHTLLVRVDDSDSSDSHTFNVKRNAPPLFSNVTPTNTTGAFLNYKSLETYSIDASDANGDGIIYTWTLDGNTSTNLSSSPTGSGSQAIFNPNGDISLIGAHVIQVVASDGTETTSQSWTVTVNYYSDSCNQLEAGEICTLVGGPGMGDGNDPQVDPLDLKIHPRRIEADGSGNFFVSDMESGVVWFYNRSGANVTRINVTIPAGTAKIVVGNGADGVGTNGLTNNNFKLRDPSGLAYDASNDRLFISDYSNHRVVMVNSSGVGNVVAGYGGTSNSSAYNQEGGPAIGHYIRNPRGLAYDGANNKLYIAAYNSHAIKYVDTTDADFNNWTGHILVGQLNGSNQIILGPAEGTIGPSGTARTRYPSDIVVDSSGHVYFAEYDRCKIRMVNQTGATVSYFGGGRSVTAGNTNFIVGTGSCTSSYGSYTSARMHRPMGFDVHESSPGTVAGFYVTSTSHHRLMYWNNTASAVTIGNKSIPAYQAYNIFGQGTYGYNGDGNDAVNKWLRAPYDVELTNDNSTLFVTDVDNFRVRSLDVSTSNGVTKTEMGGHGKSYFDTDDVKEAPLAKLGGPKQLLFDANNNDLLISNSDRCTIKKLDLDAGLVSTEVGDIDNDSMTACGTANSASTADQVKTRGTRQMDLIGNSIIFADKYESNGTNRNCLVRVYNREASSTNFFGVNIAAGSVDTVAGNYGLGCNNWSGTYEGGPATSARLHRPEGVMYDGTDLFVTNYLNNCIVKVDGATGNISTFLGTCSTANGNVNGIIGDASVKLYRPGTMYLDPQNTGTGNFFFVDRIDSNNSIIKYVNRHLTNTVTISGTDILPNSVNTIYTTNGYASGVAVKDDQVCFTSGYQYSGSLGGHHVICKDRSDSLGNTTLRVGPNSGGGSQFNSEHEAAPSTSALLYAPYGLAFDADGNLYVSERSNHVIRKVKKWW